MKKIYFCKCIKIYCAAVARRHVIAVARPRTTRAHTCSSAGLSCLTARPAAVRCCPGFAALSVVSVLSSSRRRDASSLHWTSGIKLFSVPRFRSPSSSSVAPPRIALRHKIHHGFLRLSLRLPCSVVYRAMFLFSSVAPLPVLVFH